MSQCNAFSSSRNKVGVEKAFFQFFSSGEKRGNPFCIFIGRSGGIEKKVGISVGR